MFRDFSKQLVHIVQGSKVQLSGVIQSLPALIWPQQQAGFQCQLDISIKDDVPMTAAAIIINRGIPGTQMISNMVCWYGAQSE